MLLNKDVQRKNQKDYNLVLICLAKIDGGLPWLNLGKKIIYVLKNAYVSIASHINFTLTKIFVLIMQEPIIMN